jgi:peroxiredoxin
MAEALGQPIPDFRLTGTDGRRYGPGEVKGSHGLVVAVICNHCPYVRAIVDRMGRDLEALRRDGFGVLALMPNDTAAYPEDGFEAMKAFAERHRFSFPYAIDETQAAARALGAACTPEFFGYDRDLRLRYRGRLDAGGPHGPNGGGDPGRRELVEAMAAIASGRDIGRQIASIGCSIKWKPS